MRGRIASAGAALATVTIGVGVLGLTTARAATDPLTHVEQYLYGQVQADGSIAGSAGATEDVVIGTADAGYNPASLIASNGTSALDYLGSRTDAGKTTDTAGHTAKLLLALVAAHVDPTAYRGRNLVNVLNGDYQSSTGLFFSTAASETPNIFSQSFAVLALKAAGQTIPAAALTAITCAQETDGSFGYTITPPSSSTASPACADTADGGDTNSTAIALQALNAGGATSANSAALAWLHTQQQPDGGFPYVGSPTDPDSTATVVQGLVAAGGDPAAAAWTVGGHSAYGSLVAQQDPVTGGYIYPGNSTPDAFTTSEIPAALAKAPYATATTFRAAAPPATSTATTTQTAVSTSTVTVNGTVSTVTAAAAASTPANAVLGVPTTGSDLLPPGAAALLLVLGGSGLCLSALGLRRTPR